MNLRTRATIVALALGAAGAGVAGASVALGADATQTFSQSMNAGTTVSVRAIDGTITVTRTSGPAVARATGTTRGGGAPDMHLVQERNGSTWSLCVVPIERNACSGGDTTIHDRHTRVDVALALPANVTLDAADVSGDVRATGLASDVDAKDVSGDVDVDTTQHVNAETVSGTIVATMGAPGAAPRFRSVSGDIRVTIPRTANLAIHASSLSGDVTANGFAFAHGSSLVGHDDHATLGKGGSTLTLQTVRGSITVTAR